MATQVKYVSVPSKTLAASINAAAASIQLSDIKGWDGNNLSASNFGDVLWVVLRDSSNTFMEIMQLDPTTIASASITILKRGLDFSGGTTEVTANKLTWIKNDTIVELGSNPPQLLAQSVALTGNQTITDLKTFLTLPQCTAVPTAASDLANKAYVDSLATGNANYDQNIVSGTAGAALTKGQIAYQSGADGKWYVADSSSANTSVAVPLGIVQATVLIGAACRILIAGRDKSQTGLTAGGTYYLSTAGAISTNKGANIRLVGRAPDATTDIVVDFYGASNGDVNLTDNSRLYVADTGAVNVMVVTYVPAFFALKTGQVFYLKVGNTNTTAVTVNINGLGAKTIKKGNVLDLASGDIVAGQIIAIGYDGTNMQLLSPVANVPLSAASLKFGGTGSDGALSISSGTTTLSCSSLGYLEKNYTSISITGSANLAFSSVNNNSGTSVALRSQGGVTITTSSTAAIDLRLLGGGFGTANFPANSPLSTGGGLGGAGGGSTGGRGGDGGYNNASNGNLELSNGGPALGPITPYVRWAPPGGNGTGGGSGGANGFTGAAGGAGGIGGGGLYIECGGAYNFTTGAINASGQVGGNGSSGGGGATGGGGGGGGGGGNILVIYSTLTANTGTYNVAAGGGGGTAVNGSGGQSGAAGSSLVVQNTHWL